MTFKIAASSLSNKETLFTGNGITVEGVPSWIPKANFDRTQTDLIATNNNGDEFIFVDYFTNHELPSIQTENGLFLKGSLLESLAGSLAPGQYAQAAGSGMLSIGEVSSVKGVAKATRIDGNVFTLSSGDPIFKGDVVETEGSGSVGLVFLDKTTMSLSEGGKMVLDELVYDPATGDGSMAVDMLEGAFSFVSGEIAKTGPDAMSVSTPVATIGIRGTTVAGKAAVEGNENSFTLLQDAGGSVGEISITNSAGTQTLSQVGATTSITSFSIAPPTPIILTPAQIQADYGTALAVLPPTPIVAPQPQAPPPPQEQQQEQQQQEEGPEEEISSDEEVTEEEVIEEGSAEAESEVLAEGEEGLGPDGEPLEEGLGPDGEPLAEGEEGPPVGPDGEPNVEQIATADEAFETAMADGATPEEAMAAAAEAGGFDLSAIDSIEDGSGEEFAGLGGDFIDDPFGGSGGDFGGDLFADSGEEFDGSGADLFGGGEQLGVFGATDSFSVSPLGSDFGGPGVNIGDLFDGPEEDFGISSGDFGEANIFGSGNDFGFIGVFDSSSSFVGPIDFSISFSEESFTGGFNDFGDFSYNDFSNGFDVFADDIYESSLEDSYTEEYYYEDPSMFESDTSETTYAEESETSSTITGDESSNILVGTDDGIRIEGLGGPDTITGGAGNDVIYGGEGIDILKGGLGDDQFYYATSTDGYDIVTDFGTGSDTFLIDYTPSHSYYTRGGFYITGSTDLSVDISSNSYSLPNVFNFTNDFDNIPTGDYANPVEVAKSVDMDFTNIDLTIYNDGHVSSYILVFGDDESNSSVFLWEDLDYDTSFYLDSNELTLMAVLEGYDNDNLTSNEITFTTTL